MQRWRKELILPELQVIDSQFHFQLSFLTYYDVQCKLWDKRNKSLGEMLLLENNQFCSADSR